MTSTSLLIFEKLEASIHWPVKYSLKALELSTLSILYSILNSLLIFLAYLISANTSLLAKELLERINKKSLQLSIAA